MITDTNRKFWVAATCGITGGLILLDETVVGVALPDMGEALGMTPSGTHWVVSAYMLTFAVFALAAGRVGDMLGTRRMFVTGALLFAATSIVAAMAQNGAMLIGARAAQGFAAAVVFPMTFALVTKSFPASERATALGLITAIGGTMLALGPIVGGALTSYLSWRLIFVLNVPITLIAIIGVLALIPRAPKQETAPLDWKGLAILVPGLTFVVFALMEGPTWQSGVGLLIAVAVAGVGLMALFVWVERGTPSPLVDVELLTIPKVVGGSLIFFTGQLSKIVVVVFVPLYLQHQMGMSAVASGTVMLAAVVGTPFVAVPMGHVADRFGAHIPAIGGLILATISTVMMGVTLSVGSNVFLVVALFLWGLSLQAMLVPSAGTVMGAVPHERQGEASGITVAARLLGSVIGMAGGSAVYSLSGRYDVVLYAMLPLLAVSITVGVMTIGQAKHRAA